MASRTPHRSTRLSSRKDIVTPETTDETVAPDAQLEDADLALVPTEDEDEEEIVPVAGRDVTTGTAVQHQSFAERIQHWYFLPSYLRDSILELLKVTWPSRKETGNLTLVVIIMAAIFTVVFGALDALFLGGLNAVIAHLK